jgi:magnesium-protoporphyrin O-methyltransferase
LDTAQHKAQLRRYFDGIGFERWAAIYGEGELSGVRRSIRAGHSAMLTAACAYLDGVGPGVDLPSALDAGCGTGLFSLELAQRGYAVTAADLAPQMAAATSERLAAAGHSAECKVADLEELSGRYDLVACFDVLIHYPAGPFAALLRHLAGLTSGRLLFTYAPHSPLLAALHKVGGFFPHSQRRTEIQMIKEAVVQRTLGEAGLTMRRSRRISSGFYHVTLVEATR